MKIDRKFPTVASMESTARRRVPRFAFEYLIGGIGAERGLRRNREALDAVTLRPRYLTSCVPDLTCNLLGRKYDLPFGISPMGLSGLIWPRSAEFLAATAERHKIPFVLSTFATTRLEEVIQIAPEHAWFQLSLPNDQAIAVELITRVKRSGYETLVLTIDVPTATRRERDIRNGLSIPPRLDARTTLQILKRPQWAVRMLQSGIPEFENLKPFLPPKQDLVGIGNFISRIMEGGVTPEGLKRIRDQWEGKLVVKGVLDPADARTCQQIGTDAIIVSNHGGRQLDAAPAPIEVLPEVRRAIGMRMPVLVDGGIRSGLDIARAIAYGADFVFLARAFMFGVAAIGRQGGDHVVSLLREELRSTLAQLGCRSPADLPGFVWSADSDERRTTHEPGDD